MSAAPGPTRAAFATIGEGARQLLRVRWVRIALAVLAAAIVFRLALGLLLHRAIDVLIAPKGLACRWDGLDLSILSGKGELRRLELSPRDRASQPLAVVDYASFDLRLRPLLAGNLRVRRLEIDGLHVLVERAEDGSWPLSGFAAADASTAPSAAAPIAAKAEKVEPIDLSPPFSFEALRIHDVTARLVDRTFTPPVDREIQLDIGIAASAGLERRSRFSATLTGNKVVDGGRIEGTAEWARDRFTLDVRAQLGGLRPRELAPWLEPLGIRPACDAIEGRFAAHVEADVLGDARHAVAIRASVSDLAVAADGAEALALDRLDVDVDSLSRTKAALSRIEISGARAAASLETSGSLHIAGLDLTTEAPPEGGRSSADALSDVFQVFAGEHVPPWASLLVRDDPKAFAWTLERIAFGKSELRVVDRRVDPPAEIPIVLDSLEIGRIAHERTPEPRPFPVEARIRVPGTAETVRVHGRIAPFVPRRSIDLEVSVEDITLSALEGYLRAAGLERTIEGGGIRFRVQGLASTDARNATEGWIELEESLAVAGREVSELGSVRACDLRFDPEARLVRFGELVVSGAQIAFGRDPSRRMVAFGLRTLGMSSPRSAVREVSRSRASSEPAVPEPTRPPPRVEIGRLALTDSRLLFVDESFDPPKKLAVDPIGFELTGLTVGGDPADADPPPAHFRARAVAPGVFDELVLEGTVATRLGGIDLTADLALSGTGLRGAEIAPYLEEIGIEPTLADGKAGLGIHGELVRRDGWRGGWKLANGFLSDGGNPILSLKELRIEDVVEADGEITIGEIAVEEPFARLERARGSGVGAAGLRLAAKPASPPKAERPVASSPPALSLPELPSIRLARAELSGARIAWRDEGLDPPVEAELLLDASATDLGTTGMPGRASARLRIPGNLESLELASGVVLGPSGLRLAATVDASGIHAGPLSRLLPPGTSLDGDDGRLHVAFETEIAPAPGGGLRARASLSDLSWGETTCKSARFEVPRIDTASGVLELGPVRVEGLEIEARRDADGALHALGFRIEEAPPAVKAPAPTPEPPRESQPPSPRVAAPSASPIFKRADLVGEVALGIERFVFRDESFGSEARPLEASVGLRVESPRVLYRDRAEDLSPIPWSLEGKIAGLVESWRIDGSLAPFAAEPSLEATLAATGIRTQAIPEIDPALAKILHGDVDDGTAEGKLDVKLTVHRAGPGDLGLRRPFGADVRLEDIAFRRAPGGEVLAGVDSVVLDADRIDLARGLVHVKSLEIARPRGVARRTETSLSTCGIAFDLAKPAAEAEVTDPAPEPEKETAKVLEASAPPPDPAAGEVRIERLLVSGIAAELRDERTEPPRVLPFEGLDVEMRGITTRALRERSSVRVQAMLTGGPPTVHGASPKDASPWLDEIALSADVALKPEPSGWLRLSLAGLDLKEIARYAPAESVTVSGGTLDVSTSVRLAGAKGARVQTTLVFSDLEVTEPKGGPIERSLALPVALNAALFLLRNPAGEHRISVGFSVDEHGLSSGGIALAAAEATAQVLAVALAGAPLRLLTAFVPVDEKHRGAIATGEVAFAAGSSELPADTEARLFRLRKMLAAHGSASVIVRHELGSEDCARAERLANPTDGECRDLVLRARQEKAGLLRERGEAATRARALLAVGSKDSGAALDRLRGFDRELASVEKDLDRLLEILGARSPRQAQKRTKLAAMEIGQDRLDAVMACLRAGVDAEDLARIEVSSPRFDPRKDGGPGRVIVELRAR